MKDLTQRQKEILEFEKKMALAEEELKLLALCREWRPAAYVHLGALPLFPPPLLLILLQIVFFFVPGTFCEVMPSPYGTIPKGKQGETKEGREEEELENWGAVSVGSVEAT